jgi:hypothetical protein
MVGGPRVEAEILCHAFILAALVLGLLGRRDVHGGGNMVATVGGGRVSGGAGLSRA